MLKFEPHDPGITPHLTEYRDANLANWWSWGVQLADIDGDGKLDIYVTTHHAEHGLAYRQGDDLQFSPLETGFLPSEMPAGRPPFIADFTGSGKADIVSASSDHPVKTKLQNADGSFVPGSYKTASLQNARMVDAGGLPSIVGYTKSWGVSYEHHYSNLSPDPSFEATIAPVPIPADIPEPIRQHLQSLEGNQSHVRNRYAGPTYWRGDLNGNGREDMIIQYGGSYGGGEFRFGRYLLRNEEGVLEDVTDTCGIPGHLLPILPPADTAGNGRLSVLVGYGSLAEVGLYVQNEDGTFTRQTDGKTVHQTKTMERATYHTSASYFYEANWLDLTGNGSLDCIISGRRLGWLRVYENVDGVLTERYVINHWDADGYAIGDITGNGKPDIVVGHWLAGESRMQGAQVTAWLNTTEFDPPTDPEDPEDPDDPEPEDPEPEPEPLVVRLMIDGVVSEQTVEVLLNGLPIGDSGDELDVIIGLPPTDPDEPQAIHVTPETIELVEQAQPGQSFLLAEGCYRPFTIRNRERITVKADGLVQVHGRTSLHNHAITVRDSPGVTIDGLTCSGGNAGIGAYKSHDLVIRNCTLRNNDNWGLFTSFCDDTIAENNNCHDNVGQHGIYISNSSQRPILTGNTCTGHSRSGIQINADKYSGGTGITHGAIVTDNQLTGNAIGINLDGCSDSLFERNLIGDGLRLFRIDGTEASSRNMIRDNYITVRVDQSAVLVRNGSTGNVFEKNVIELPKTNSSWTFCISAYSDSDFVSRENVFIGRPFGGGTWGKDAKTLEEMGDIGSIVR